MMENQHERYPTYGSAPGRAPCNLLCRAALGPGEALVRLRSASLNFLDIAVATGKIPVPAFPLVLVTDGAGEIVELGEGVTGWSVGDRVIAHFMPDWQGGTMTPTAIVARRGLTRPGSLAEYVAVLAASLVAIPGHLSFAEAATLPIAATSASYASAFCFVARTSAPTPTTWQKQKGPCEQLRSDHPIHLVRPASCAPAQTRRSPAKPGQFCAGARSAPGRKLKAQRFCPAQYHALCEKSLTARLVQYWPAPTAQRS